LDAEVVDWDHQRAMPCSPFGMPLEVGLAVPAALEGMLGNKNVHRFLD